MTVRISAYVLAADPAYLEASIRSYLPLVDQVIVSFDESHRGWTGKAMDVERCLYELADVVPSGKIVLAPGKYAAPGQNALAAETRQRQEALDLASCYGEWVLQLDADEVVPNPSRLAQCIGLAAASGADGIDYPSRWLYGQTADGSYLEQCTRWWRSAASYPGPLAVRANSVLTLARQIDGHLLRVDFRTRNTDPWHPRSARVDYVISPADAVWHFSWTRTDAEMALKAQTSGHNADFDWAPRLELWRRRRMAPIRTVIGTPLRRRDPVGWLRRTRVDPCIRPYRAGGEVC